MRWNKESKILEKELKKPNDLDIFVIFFLPSGQVRGYKEKKLWSEGTRKPTDWNIRVYILLRRYSKVEVRSAYFHCWIRAGLIIREEQRLEKDWRKKRPSAKNQWSWERILSDRWDYQPQLQTPQSIIKT